MSDICNQVQESIAWSQSLDSASSKHILECPHCSSVMVSFAELDSNIESDLEIEVPIDFANAVMDKIRSQEQHAMSGAMITRLKSTVMNAYYARFGQILAAALGSVVAVVNVIRFVLAVVIPVAG